MTAVTTDLTGVATLLRAVTAEDAAYIWSLRRDARYNTHLSAVSGTVADQRDWIARYRTREAQGTEFYFIVRRRDDGRRCGTVRVYGIADGAFTWGSWILDEAKPRGAALDTALLVYHFGFVVLGLDRAVFDVRRDNLHTLRFHDRFGARRVREDETDIFYILDRADHDRLAPQLRASLVAHR